MLGDIVIYNGSPAVVVKVNKATVNMQVFNDGNSVTYVADVPVDEIEEKVVKKEEKKGGK